MRIRFMILSWTPCLDALCSPYGKRFVNSPGRDGETRRHGDAGTRRRGDGGVGPGIAGWRDSRTRGRGDTETWGTWEVGMGPAPGKLGSFGRFLVFVSGV